MTARERPDVALVGLGDSSDHALDLIEKIVQEAACPVIVLIHAPDPASSGRRRSAASSPTSPTATPGLAELIDIVLRRFAEYHDLEGAFGRRAMIERAKGILMERHSVDEDARLRDAARPFARGEPQARRHRRRRRRRTPPSAQAGARAGRLLAADCRGPPGDGAPDWPGAPTLLLSMQSKRPEVGNIPERSYARVCGNVA